MTLAHTAYLFEAQEFRREIDLLRPSFEQGNLTLLHERAHNILKAEPKLWDILDGDFRYDPGEQRDYDEDEELNQKFWTFIILAHYLIPCPSIDNPTWKVPIRRKWENIPRAQNWQVLRHVLKVVGWNERDIFLLIEGMSIPWLFGLVSDPIERLKPSHAWHSLFRTGWLDLQEARRLLSELEKSERDIYAWKPTALPLHFNRGEPVPAEQVELAFVCALGMLKTADVAKKDLLLAILS